MTVWLAGWQRRREHGLLPGVGITTGYQLPVTVHYGSGTDTLADVYLAGKCKPDFSDIRFADADGNLIPFWRKSKTDSDNAVYWLKINADLSVAASYYVYYGCNLSETEVDLSDMDAVFDAVIPNVQLALPLDEGSSEIGGWLVNWTKRKSLTINAGVGAGTDYQVIIKPTLEAALMEPKSSTAKPWLKSTAAGSANPTSATSASPRAIRRRCTLTSYAQRSIRLTLFSL